MTTKELTERISKLQHASGSCCYYVEIYYRGKFYSCHSNNAPAWDRFHSDDCVPARAERNGYTVKGALKAFYEECKKKNALYPYNIV